MIFSNEASGLNLTRFENLVLHHVSGTVIYALFQVLLQSFCFKLV